MEDCLQKLKECVEFGKINQVSPYPAQLKGQPGADEWAKMALDEGISPRVILDVALIPAMDAIGTKFSEGKAFVPQMLLSAKAMNFAMKHLKPYYQSGAIKQKGIFIIGTAQGDLHDIGKNLVGMMAEGSGWKVIDLGTDVPAEKYIKALDENPYGICGISALLTTTMSNMRSMVSTIREKYPSTKIAVGGPPLSTKFAMEIGANAYCRDAQENVEWLNSII